MVGEVDKQATLEGTADPDHHMIIHQEDKKNIEKNTEKIEEKEATQTMIEDTKEKEVVVEIEETSSIMVAIGQVHEGIAGRLKVSEGLLQAPPWPRSH